MLELKNINVSFRSERQDKIFGYTRQQVLFDVSLAVKEGTCLGILGESGSGKSTMGRVLCGLLKPDSGEAVLDGVSVYASRAGRRNLQNKLSIVFQDYTTIQHQILKQMRSLQEEYGTSIIFITHDLTSITYLCDDVLFLYQGRVTENLPVERIGETKDEYARKLLESIVVFDTEESA